MTTDDRFLHSLGVTTADPMLDDGHQGCRVRWLDERRARELAEQSAAANLQAYKVLIAAAEAQAARWQRRCAWAWLVVLATFAFFDAWVLRVWR